MPCWTVQQDVINFEKAQGHEDLLTDALKELGYTATRYGTGIQFSGHGVQGSYSGGRFNTSGAAFDSDAVKQNFGKQVVKKACKQFGWTIKPGKTANTFQVTKRA